MDATEMRRDSHIRRARQRSGVGVRELARRLQVSPATVLDWERSEERGTVQMNTVERALEQLGESLVTGTRRVNTAPGEDLVRREDRVTLELHRAVAVKLLQNPTAVLAVVPENLAKLRAGVRGEAARSWVDEWTELTQGFRIGALVDVMLGTDQRSRDMRQASPFLGVLDHTERIDAIRRASAP